MHRCKFRTSGGAREYTRLRTTEETLRAQRGRGGLNNRERFLDGEILGDNTPVLDRRYGMPISFEPVAAFVLAVIDLSAEWH